jgi:hypothetical protein
LQGGPIDFGEARFLGYQVDDRAIFQDEDAHFRLCWTAQSEDDLPVPYAFALHIVGDANHIVGRRESYPGMGTYTLWQANRAFCDDFTLTITEALEPARAYDISLTLFDVASGESMPASIIGQMRSPAPPVSESEMQGAPFRFGDIHLVDYTLSVDDQSLQLELVWGTAAAVNMDTRLFVHVIASDGDIAAQIDPPPGAYPMAMWGGGERIMQSLTVPLDDVFDGVYTVRIGLYDPATFVRLPVRDATSDAIPDDAAPMGNFTRR